MKVLTAAQMREVDRRTSELGIPGIVLMENAGHRVVEFLERERMRRSPSSASWSCAAKATMAATGWWWRGSSTPAFIRARSAWCWPAIRRRCAATRPQNYRMLEAVGCPVSFEVTRRDEDRHLIVDALLGTGIHGAAAGKSAELIRAINASFPLADVVSVDLPSGLDSDSGDRRPATPCMPITP